ncbi:hypothetical protein B5E87_06375 [Massilimicrobiota sp. An142]|uniref:hypothetical protein n=1 Tax=Massilimicrobiota sp. An142 TaxID=1965564 RepID=UPI000B38FB29|nr:hypothetical protein [Massilimicrobiota sp. An142]OUQ13336.1 hypothetical protein B5E87_06375 [Massilimicrobiota sp. An142]
MKAKLVDFDHYEQAMYKKVNFLNLNKDNINDNYPDGHSMAKYSMGMFLDPDTNIAYIGFYISWVVLQFRIESTNTVNWRMKFGGNAWSQWTNI